MKKYLNKSLYNQNCPIRVKKSCYDNKGTMNIHETIYETFLLLPGLIHLITASLMVLDGPMFEK